MVQVFEGNTLGLHSFTMDGYLKENLDELVKAITKDFMFCIIISGGGNVRVGKSVLGMHNLYYLVNETNRVHDLNNTVTLDNIVYTGQDLIDKSIVAPKGAGFMLDEGDDLLDGYWAKVTRDLKRYFRKSGQLNQFVIIITPNFFSIPIEIATNYSTILLDCYFSNGFERGRFRFFNKERKRQLYLKGKKEQNYYAVAPNFVGSFPNFYPFGEQEYRNKKHSDLSRMASPEKVTRADVKANRTKALSVKVLRDIGLTYEEIGEKLEMSPDAARFLFNTHYKYPNEEKPTILNDKSITLKNNLEINNF